MRFMLDVHHAVILASNEVKSIPFGWGRRVRTRKKYASRQVQEGLLHLKRNAPRALYDFTLGLAQSKAMWRPFGFTVGPITVRGDEKEF